MGESNYQELLNQVRSLPESRIYKNSTPVVNVRGIDLTVWNVLTAALIGNLNTLIVGERGEGKTQLLNELKNTLFGGKATYIRMRDNLRTKDLYEVYNKEKLFEKKGKISDAKETTNAINNGLTIIDEINRAHEKIQNQVFDIYDGYIIFEGPEGTQKVNLGIKVENDLHYHSAVASANIGADRYTGISPIDPALLDRSHVILNIDNYAASTIDNVLIIGEAKTAKIVDEYNDDRSTDIVEIYKQVNNVRLSFDALITLLYLKKGLDNCINPENPTNRKLPVLSSIPNICEGCRELANGCGYTLPISIRTEKATLLLAKALKVVADSKSKEEPTPRVKYQDVLSAFTLIGPYSGILDESWVDKEFLGNQQIGINRLVNNLSKELSNLSKLFQTTFNESLNGQLKTSTKNQFKGRWEWYGDLLVAFNDAAKRYGKLKELEESELNTAAKECPILEWIK